MSYVTRLCKSGGYREEALENIKDAVRGYLLAAKKARRVEKLAKVEVAV